MKIPCETVVWYIVPAIKSELAKELSNRRLPQKRIAEAIDVTQAAVSQYLSKKRGSSVELTPLMKREISRYADKVLNGTVGRDGMQKLICNVCTMAKKTGLIEKCGA